VDDAGNDEPVTEEETLMLTVNAYTATAETQEMLDFCAVHGIEPEIELIDVGAINDAWDRLLRSEVRYRFVIDAASLRTRP
jgi:alcohol dehydrogenase (NADP+)